ncbi:RNA polymerase sigma factor [Saccharothrix isguenensis]
MTSGDPVEHVLRTLAPQVLGILVRRHGDFARCEDAVQEALIDAAATWSRDGVPEHPLGWLTTVAARRYVDQVRSDAARERREQALFDAVPRDRLLAPPPDAEPVRDDLLELLFLCCHPALTPTAQMALTLRAVAGLTTTEIASAFLVPDKTMGQRISRAKQRLREVGARFELPPDHERGPALGTVLHVLYLLFNEGYSAGAGPALRRPDLTDQAMRLTRELHRRLPDSGETTGLLALMLLTEARAATRTGPDGVLVPLADQDRSRWDRTAIAEGTDLVTRSLTDNAVGPYQVQAAIAAVHCEAASAEDTDWPQVLALYDVLERLAPSPVAALNRAVAVGEVHGPRAALDIVAELERGVLAGNHRLFAVRGHLLEQAGDPAAASESFRRAARLAGNVPEQRFLLLRAARCAPTG